jgi:hypothetical protein
VPVTEERGQFRALGDNLHISIAKESKGSVELRRSDQGSSDALRVGLPTGARKKTAVLAQDGTVTYPETFVSTDVAVQAFADGVRIQTILRDGNAPSEFSYPLVMPTGAKISAGEDGSLAVFDSRGDLKGGFASPWAKDSKGLWLPTRYEVRGASVVQVVDHSGAAYPVVADPYLGINLISSASWVLRSPDGWTLQVAPTGWARIQAGGYVPGVAGWNELYSRYKKVGRGIKVNLDGMRDQWICHQQVVALRAPNRATWNLDEWRPNVSYAQTVNSFCNPGGARWFD